MQTYNDMYRKIQMSPGETIEELRRMARTDLYFFAKVVLGFHDMNQKLHGAMCRFLMSLTLRKLLVISRGHLKTSVGVHAYVPWRIINNPNIRILLVNASKEKSSASMYVIRRILEGGKSEMFNVLFPEVVCGEAWIGRNMWNNTQLLIPRTAVYKEATVECVGVGAGTAGRHHDVIIKDDLIDEKSCRSEAEIQYVIDWHKTSDALFDVPETGQDIIIGTPWGFNDYLDHIINTDKRYETFHRGCYDDDGEPIFPEKFSKDGLDALRAGKEYEFSCQYLCKPQASFHGAFDMSMLKFYEYDDKGIIVTESGKVDPKLCDRVMLVDPAKSKLRTDCNSAIVVAAVNHDQTIYLLEAWRGAVDPNGLIDKMYEFQGKYKCRVCGIESVGYQEALVAMVDNASKVKSKPFCRVEPLHPGQNAKDERIRGLLPYAKNGQIFIRHDMKDFITEWTMYGRTKDRDILDALAYGPRVWARPISPASKADRMVKGFSLYGGRPQSRLTLSSNRRRH